MYCSYTGKYLKLMELLPLVAKASYSRWMELFDLYIYTVCTTFVAPKYLIRLFSGNAPSDMKTDTLRSTVEHIRKNLQFNVHSYMESSSSGHALNNNNNSNCIAIPETIIRNPNAIEHPTPGNLSGLAERCVASETLVFIECVIDELQPIVRKCLSRDEDKVLEKCIDRKECVAQLRTFIYATIAPSIIQAGEIPGLILNHQHTSWNLNHFSERHHPYVIDIIEQCGAFWGRVQNLSHGAIPMRIRQEIWSFAIRAVMESLVEGFSKVKDCTLQGRALMSMDIQALQNGLNSINTTR